MGFRHYTETATGQAANPLALTKLHSTAHAPPHPTTSCTRVPKLPRIRNSNIRVDGSGAGLGVPGRKTKEPEMIENTRSQLKLGDGTRYMLKSHQKKHVSL